jgi:hypothetical protein
MQEEPVRSKQESDRNVNSNTWPTNPVTTWSLQTENHKLAPNQIGLCGSHNIQCYTFV